MESSQRPWHEHAVIYQIYPRSFKDGLGTGVGNLKGITSKLDYLRGSEHSLGVDAIWISPIYLSPMADFGYDVADYTAIDPMFGTLEDFSKLLKEAHHRGIKIIMDFVPNHTSEEHSWFRESSSSKANPRRDWYVWRDPAPDGGPPNNWLSIFGGSAWEFSKTTGQYYMHSYLKEQPELNWDNPQLREAMKLAMRFWLNLGVDGFRVDAVDTLSKHKVMKDDPINHYQDDEKDRLKYETLHHHYSREGPDLFKYLAEMAEVVGEYDNRFMVTEGHPEVPDIVQGYLDYYEQINPALCSPFNFEMIYLPWHAANFKHFVDKFQAAMKPGYIPSYSLGNHDESRLATRIGTSAARTAAMLLMTLPGQKYIYYGDELGMADTPMKPSQYLDPRAAHAPSRDPERTPMQWNDSKYAGFSTKKPWLPVAPDYDQINVEAEMRQQKSILNLYRELIKLHHALPELQDGEYVPLACHDGVFGYERKTGTSKLIVLLNFTDQHLPVPAQAHKGKVIISTYMDRKLTPADETGKLRPHEGLIIRS